MLNLKLCSALLLGIPPWIGSMPSLKVISLEGSLYSSGLVCAPPFFPLSPARCLFGSLIIIGMALLFARTSLESWETNRTLLGWSFGRLITRDGLVLALADFQLLAMMYFCVPFVKGLQNRWYSYHWVGMVIQHTYQTFYLGVAIWWGYHRQWYWVQSGFLVLRE